MMHKFIVGFMILVILGTTFLVLSGRTNEVDGMQVLLLVWLFFELEEVKEKLERSKNDDRSASS